MNSWLALVIEVGEEEGWRAQCVVHGQSATGRIKQITSILERKITIPISIDTLEKRDEYRQSVRKKSPKRITDWDIPLVERNMFLALRGAIANNGQEFAPSYLAVLGSQLQFAINSLCAGGREEVLIEGALGYAIILRRFANSATARDWVATQVLPKQLAREHVTKNRVDPQAALRAAIESSFVELPFDFAARRKILIRAFDMAREEIAKAFEPVLNEVAAKMPQATYEEKKELAKWVNAELRRFGLAIKNPHSGKPCLLMGNPGGKPGFGRFLLEYTDDTGKRHHPLTSVTLPHLDLVPDELTRASYEARVRRPG